MSSRLVTRAVSIFFFSAIPAPTTFSDLNLGMPLPMRDAPNAPRPEPETITNATIYDCIAAPHPADIQEIMRTILTTSDVTSCLNTVNTLKSNKGLALADILSALADQLQQLEVPAQTRISWLEGLAEIEWRLSGGGSETVQTGGLVGVVRNGCELMGEKGVGLA
jgi:replication factor C subunit 3/5